MKVKVYDLPTRLFHWIFGALFLGAFLIAKNIDDDSALYPVHMMLGMTMAVAVVLRVLWGIFGSKFARFSSFQLNPIALINYFKSIVTSKSIRTYSHNPASSWAALVMMALALTLAFTGFMMAKGVNKDFFEEIHELSANAFIIVVIGHVAGVLLHMFKHRDAIALSMMTGKKTEVAGEVGIENNHIGAGLVFLIVLGLFGFNLNKNYDPTNRTLNLFGNQLQLGENESAEHENSEQTGEQKKDDGRNDDGDDD